MIIWTRLGRLMANAGPRADIAARARKRLANLQDWFGVLREHALQALQRAARRLCLTVNAGECTDCPGE